MAARSGDGYTEIAVDDWPQWDDDECSDDYEDSGAKLNNEDIGDNVNNGNSGGDEDVKGY